MIHTTPRRSFWPARSIAAGFVLAASLLAGCATDPNPVNAPLSAIPDMKAHTDTRIRAIRRAWDAAESGEASPASVRETLKRVAWQRGSWSAVRVAAIEELLKDEPNLDDTRTMMRFMLPTETSWDVITAIANSAGERGWTDLTAVLVRSWSRPVDQPADDLRPERLALQKLHPSRAPEDVVFDVFRGEILNGKKPLTDRERQDAWSLLRRVDREGQRTLALLSTPPDEDTLEDPMIRTLRQGSIELAVVPDTGEELAWLDRLGAPAAQATWDDCASAVAKLGAEQRQGLRLRHVLGAAWAQRHQPGWLSASRAELVSELERVLEPRPRNIKPGTQEIHRGAGESVRIVSDQLTWGDALLALIAARLADDQALATALFAHADDDHKDTSTEHGGVIDEAGAGFAIRRFPPRANQRAGDERFIAPDEMLVHGSDALFHYHFHVNKHKNADYAAPSEDDIKYATTHGRACLVFTFISASTLAIDYYQPGGVVIDMGEFNRPAPR